MFTGIIEETGIVKKLARKGSSVCLGVSCDKARENVKLGDSIAVNGVCLSVVEAGDSLIFDVVLNTLNKTTLKRLKPGDKVNLERALKMGDTLGGHIVSGHIDVERRVKKNQKTSAGWVLDVEMLPGDEKHLIEKGSVSIDGISLTVGEVSRGHFTIYLIPHTLDNTTVASRKAGDYVNVEFDMLAKYADRKDGQSSVTEDMLRDKGFI